MQESILVGIWAPNIAKAGATAAGTTWREVCLSLVCGLTVNLHTGSFAPYFGATNVSCPFKGVASSHPRQVMTSDFRLRRISQLDMETFT